MKTDTKGLGQKGFTIIELMIATAVFSVVLLIASNGVVQIGRLYYKGIVEAKTQEAARATAEEIARTLQLSEDDLVDPTPAAITVYTGTPSAVGEVICIGDTRYTYQINRQVNATNGHGLWYDTKPAGDPCVPVNLSLATPSNGRELLGENMRLLRFAVSNGVPGTYNVAITVAYGDNDLLTYYPPNAAPATAPAGNPDGGLCRSGVPGGNFCDVAGLATTVKKRVN